MLVERTSTLTYVLLRFPLIFLVLFFCASLFATTNHPVKVGKHAVGTCRRVSLKR